MQNILILGGGHGLSAVVEALKDEKDYTLTALVSTSDSGGHTGKLIEEFDIPAIGDIRRNFASSLDNFPLLKEMLNYRFDYLHKEKNVSLGNLMILSLLEKYSLEEIMIRLKKEFQSNILILPLYNKYIDLWARYQDNTIEKKEHLIPKKDKIIKDVFYQEKVSLTNNIINNIKKANAIIIGPGSLYTSVGAVLADTTIQKLVKESKAKIIYICNIMTEPNETDNYDVLNHLNFIENKIGKVDYVIANKKGLSKTQKEKYAKENSFPVKCNKNKRIIYKDLLDTKQEYVRHNSIKLKKALREIIDKN